MLETLLFILTVVQLTDCNRLDLDDFSISVHDSFTGEVGLCIRVFCSYTVSKSVSEPIRKSWFKGDPLNPTVEVPCTDYGFSNGDRGDCSFQLNNLVQGEFDGDYRLKMEWEEVYVFRKIVQIIVKELTEKPAIEVPLLTAGEEAEITCTAPGTCLNPKLRILWEGIEPERIEMRGQRVIGRDEQFSIFIFHPEPEHHNVNLTCRVIVGENIQTEATVTLEVRYAPTILNSSRCLPWGDELICMCISSGVPLPLIYWATMDNATEYYSAFSAKNIISIIILSTDSLRNPNVTINCISVNPIGFALMEIPVYGNPKESWTMPTSWIFLTISVVLNMTFATCLIVIQWRGKRKAQDDNHVYMTAMKREESLYETIKMSSERS